MHVSAKRFSLHDSGAQKEPPHVITWQELALRRQAARRRYLRALVGLDRIVSQLPGDGHTAGIISTRDRARIEKATTKQRIAFDKYMDAVRQMVNCCGHAAP
jgi:hypothetical protein